MRLLTFFALFLAATPPAQVWLKREPGSRPTPRYGHAMVFDEARGVTILFGGEAPFSGLPGNDTWLYDGLDWRQVQPAQSPPARSFHAMAYDRHRGRTMLFGGKGPGGPMNDLWEWDGLAWNQLAPPIAPPAVYHHGLVYDQARRRLVLGGGRGLSGTDLWEFDGNTWIRIQASAVPLFFEGVAMAYDSGRGRTVLAGGRQNEPGPSTPALWEWDGTMVHQGPAMPFATAFTRMAYRPYASDCLVFGVEALYILSRWTLTYDGRSWRFHGDHPAPERLFCPGLAFDTRRNRVVLFGGAPANLIGSQETWEFLDLAPASFQAIGPGCPGTNAKIPRLLARKLPILGQTFIPELQDLPPLAWGALLLGWAPARLDLGPFGASGCTAWTSGHCFFPFFADFNGAWHHPNMLHVPADTNLGGGAIYLQALVLDPKANDLGLITSNGAKAVVGL